eukprot:scaffold61255_cov47-Attheya_sp.AAC.1
METLKELLSNRTLFWLQLNFGTEYATITIHHKAINNSPPTMDYSLPMPATNTTSNTLTRLDIPRFPPLPPPSLSLLRTWLERVVGASLDVWSMFPTQMQINAVTSLVDVDVCGGKLLYIVKTGACKSHVEAITFPEGLASTTTHPVKRQQHAPA